MGAAFYALYADGYRPSWADARRAYYGLLLYVAVIMPFDLLTGLNYGYMGKSLPGPATIGDYLGPWPWRVVIVLIGIQAIFALLAAPWAGRASVKPSSNKIRTQ